MKRPLLILLGLVVAAALAYGASQWYMMRGRHHDPTPPSADPLAWMQRELHVNDATLAKVRQLHQSYQPTCGEMCMGIANANARVRALLESSRSMTPELEEAIRQAQLR
jgi:hypothetical protein